MAYTVMDLVGIRNYIVMAYIVIDLVGIRNSRNSGMPAQEWSLVTRGAEEELVPTCRELGIGFVACI